MRRSVVGGSVRRVPFLQLERLDRRTLLSSDFVLAWNAIALEAVANDYTPSVVAAPEQYGPTRTARALAIVHAAIFDAVNSIDGSYTPYLMTGHGPKGASVEAAIAQAAHDTLVVLYPSQSNRFHDELITSLAEIPDGSAERRGVAVGKQVARAVLKARLDDGSELEPFYSEPALPGVFETFPGEPDPISPGWGDVTPFTMAVVADYMPGPPPALSSAEYAAAYDEVKDYGSDGVSAPTLRSAEQTEIGIFWSYDGSPALGTPPRLYNQIIRTVAEQQGNTQIENARLFALANLSMADAGVAAWAAKYTYDFWRPIRGIRQVNSAGISMDDGNVATVADEDWTPLGSQYTNAPPGSSNFTPPFPAYTSGHATIGAAMFRTLAKFYGRDDISFTFVSDELNGVNRGIDGIARPLSPRSFTSFSEAAEENGQSRIYLGVHWSFDKVAGIEVGRAIADHAFSLFLRPAGRHFPHAAHVVPAGSAPLADGGWRSASREVLSDEDNPARIEPFAKKTPI